MSKVYTIITERIMEQIRKGTPPWHKPWKGRGAKPTSLFSGKAYRGINALVLGSAGYDSPWWLTFKQANERGGKIRKGERGYPCVYWNWVEKEDRKTGETSKVPIVRYYTLFNSEQTDGVDVPASPERTPARREHTPIEECEHIVEGMPAPPEIRHGGARAYYSPLEDRVQMPPPDRFDSGEHYYSTLFHELTHATGHASRLNREELMKLTRFGDKDYSREELVAEMGSAFLAGEAGIELKVIDNSAAYLAGWLSRLANDNRVVIHAASRAQKASDYILNLENEKEDEGDEGAAGRA